MIIESGKIKEIQTGKSLAKVDVCSRITEYLPVLQMANTFKKQWTPLRVNEQVLVFDDSFIIRSIYNKDLKEPTAANDWTDITLYEDGTRIEYNTQTKTMTINAAGTINANAKTINVVGDTGDVVVNGISLVNHIHPQNSGNHYGGGANTSKPI